LKFTLESTTALSVRSVANGKFQIGDQTWTEAIGLTPDGVINDWQVAPVTELSPDTLAPLLDLQPELIIVGTGSSQVLPDRDLMFAMARSGIGLECMDTAAAARTFNVLASEGRSVAAVLYPTDT
jgi:uncharacterized protein